MKTFGVILLTTASLLTSFTGSAIEEIDVDTELQLLLDVSGSVNSSEYQLQLDGYANAFGSTDLQQAILNGPIGSIAVQLIMWSGSSQQQVMIDWSLIDSIESASSLSSAIVSLARPFAGFTAIGSAISYGYPTFQNNGFDGTQNVIDVSGDGTNNSGISPSQARALALNNGINTINGIVITESQSVQDQYMDDVIGGDDAFMLATSDFQTFEQAINQKLIGEITGTTPEGAVSIPEPSALAMFALSVLFLFRRFTTNNS